MRDISQAVGPLAALRAVRSPIQASSDVATGFGLEVLYAGWSGVVEGWVREDRGRGSSESLNKALLALVVGSEWVLVRGGYRWHPNFPSSHSLHSDRANQAGLCSLKYEEELHGQDGPEVEYQPNHGKPYRDTVLRGHPGIPPSS